LRHWRKQKFGLGVQLEIFSKIYPEILSFCAVKAKTEFYLVKNSQGLGGANAPLHPLWQRQWLEIKF
jgi:hypothetical protein